MPHFADATVREATQNSENIRCVSIIGAHGHGKTELARNLISQHGLNSTEQSSLTDDAIASETTRTAVHVLMYTSGKPGHAGAQNPYHPDSLRQAARKLAEPMENGDGQLPVVGQLPVIVEPVEVDLRTFAPKAIEPSQSNDATAPSGPEKRADKSSARFASNPDSPTSDFESERPSKRVSSFKAAKTAPRSSHRKVKPPRASVLDQPASKHEHKSRSSTMETCSPKHFRKSKTEKMASVAPYLIYLLDTPGHADFAADVASSLRLSDGAIVVVDVVEGCSTHLEALLRQTSAERVRPVLFVSGLDRCILDLCMSPHDIQLRLRTLIDGVNGSMNDSGDELLGESRICPEKGDTAFGSSTQGWGISINRFAMQYSAKFGLAHDALAKRLWDDNHTELLAAAESRDAPEGYQASRPIAKPAMTLRSAAASVTLCNRLGGIGVPLDMPQKPAASGTLLCALVLAPLAQLLRSLMSTDSEKTDVMLHALGIELNESERALKGATLVKCVMNQWINLSDVVLDMIQARLPSPQQAQNYRVENLYGGPVDDVAATAIRNCDPQGPLMVFVSRMLPAPGGGLYAIGRVFSGTLEAGSSAWLRTSHRRGGIDDSQFIKALDDPSVPSNPLIACGKLPCGNLCALTGVDQFLLKAGTITDLEDAADITTLHFGTVRPLVRVAIKPAEVDDLPKLTEALRRLSKVDPLAECSVEEWGEHVLRGSGRRHVDACLQALKEDFSPSEFVVSVPNKDASDVLLGAHDAYHVAYRETVREAASTSVCSTAPSNLCQFQAFAEPLDKRLCEDAEAGLLGRSMPQDERTRALVDHYNWSKVDAARIWCFGPGAGGANFVVDATPDSIGSSKLPEHLEVRGAVEAAYQWVTQEGALCEEAMRAIRFNVTEASLFSRGTARGSGQIIGTARRCFLAAQLGAGAGLQEPIVRCEVLCPEGSAKVATFAVFTERSGILVSETPVGCSNLLRLTFELPATNTLDLDLATTEAGCRGSAQSSFAHWISLPGSPQVPGRHQDLVLGLRRWRHLELLVPTPEEIFGPTSKLTTDDVFSDELLDLIVPSL